MELEQVELVGGRQNPLILQRWCYLADKLERSPELLSISLENIRRWKAAKRLGDTWALDVWQTLIDAALQSDRLIVFGSASLLASFPELGDLEGSPLKRTYDADLIAGRLP